jgi:hypothetical protein
LPLISARSVGTEGSSNGFKLDRHNDLGIIVFLSFVLIEYGIFPPGTFFHSKKPSAGIKHRAFWTLDGTPTPWDGFNPCLVVL